MFECMISLCMGMELIVIFFSFSSSSLIFSIIQSILLSIQVVLARRTRVITAAGIDPISWLSCLKVLVPSLNIGEGFILSS